MAVDLIQPITLGPEALDDLKQLGPNMTILEKEIAKAERAGMDMKEIKARFEQAKKLRAGLLKEYSL